MRTMRTVTDRLNRIQKQGRRMKRKCYLLFVLPVVVVMLAVKVLQTWLLLKLGKAAMDPQHTIIAKPVNQVVIKPEIVTPEPVKPEPVD